MSILKKDHVVGTGGAARGVIDVMLSAWAS